MPKRSRAKKSAQKKTIIIFFSIVFLLLLGTGFVMRRYRLAGRRIEVQRKITVLFVVRGQTSVEGNTLSVKPDLVEWFTDHPDHNAGHMHAEELVNLWNASFKSSFPNAAVTSDKTNAVLVLTDAKLNDGQIDFTYDQIITGNLEPGDLGETAIFIDSTSEEVANKLTSGDGSTNSQ